MQILSNPISALNVRESPSGHIGTVRSLCNWLWGRYYVPHNVYLAGF